MKPPDLSDMTSSTHVPTFGAKIRELRQSRAMSMRDLALRANLKSVAFIADVEKGFRNPSPEVLADIAKALETPLAELRAFDLRAPVQEIRDITERDPEWAMAFRKVVDCAGEGLTPRGLMNLLQSAAPDSQPPLIPNDNYID